MVTNADVQCVVLPVLYPNKDINVKESYYQFLLGGKLHKVTFCELSFQKKSLNDYINSIKNNPVLPNKVINDESLVISGISFDSINRDICNDLSASIIQEIEATPEIENFIQDSNKMFEEMLLLKRDLNKFADKLVVI